MAVIVIVGIALLMAGIIRMPHTASAEAGVRIRPATIAAPIVTTATTATEDQAQQTKDRDDDDHPKNNRKKREPAVEIKGRGREYGKGHGLRLYLKLDAAMITQIQERNEIMPTLIRYPN
jgi:hypothetical protein